MVVVNNVKHEQQNYVERHEPILVISINNYDNEVESVQLATVMVNYEQNVIIEQPNEQVEVKHNVMVVIENFTTKVVNIVVTIYEQQNELDVVTSNDNESIVETVVSEQSSMGSDINSKRVKQIKLNEVVVIRAVIKLIIVEQKRVINSTDYLDY